MITSGRLNIANSHSLSCLFDTRQTTEGDLVKEQICRAINASVTGVCSMKDDPEFHELRKLIAEMFGQLR